jgi:predicted MFS family arabinose efflux permease
MSLSQVVLDFYLPSMSAVKAVMHTSVSQVEYSVTLFILGSLLSQFFYGVIADRFGRRAAILAGLFLTVLGAIICASSSVIAWFLVGRLLEGFGVGAGFTVGRAIMRDLYGDIKLSKLVSYVAVGSVIISSTAPFISGLVQQHYGYYINFLVISVYTILVFIVVWLFLPESRVVLTKNPRLITIMKELSKSRVYYGYCFVVFLTYGCIAIMITAAPILFMQEYKISSSKYGLICLGVGFIYATISMLNGLIVARIGMYKLTVLGIFLLISGAVIIITSADIRSWSILALGIYFMISSMALIFPNITALALTPYPVTSGVVSGILTFFELLGGVILSLVVAGLGIASQDAMGFLLLICSCLTFFCYYFFIWQEAKND